ncbi:MAG: carboxypeptidase regulatory-like domain-containing protein, partial [Bryobacteraceae bacterium]
MKFRCASPAIFAGLILCTSALFGQDPRGTILGRVLDEAKAVIPGAEIHATNVATGVAAAAVTNTSGTYNIPFLNPGVYTVTAEAKGFKRFAREGVQVRTGESVEVNIPMELGQVSETVEVTGAPPVLETSSPSLGQVIDTRRVTELPLLAGNAFELALLTPGVVNGTDMRDRKPAFNNGDSQISTDGNGMYNNEFQIDGVSNTFADGSGHARVAFSPPQASIEEFKMQTATYDASIGHTVGSLVNVSTVSGTNQLHGEAHWFVRNRAFDAPNFFNNKAGTEPAVYQDNRYGASAGGPVYIPHVYDGRNKTFWFYAWEGNKWGVPSTYTGTAPSDAERRGDFSSLLNLPNGGNYQIYDPATTKAAGGGRFTRQPFPGNAIPTSRLDPVGTALVNFYPEPNQPGTSDGRNNFFNGVLVPSEDYYAHIAKVDHAFSENHRIFLRVDYDWWQENKNDYFNNRVDALFLHRINRGLALDDVLVLSPSFLLNLRYGMTDQEFPEYRATKGYDLSKLGFSPALTGLIDKNQATVPRVTAGAFSTISPWESGDGTNTGFTHSFVANFTKTHGTHNLRFGSDFRVYRAFGNRYPLAVSPDLAYSTTYTRGPFDNSTSAPVGQELASMLLGIPDGSMERTASYAMQDQY